jgi:hypothetical protein
MYETKLKSNAAMGVTQVRRRLANGETIPGLPCLTDQIQACRHELARGRRKPAQDSDANESANDEDGDLD